MSSYIECILSISSEALEVVFEERPRELIRCKDCVYFSSDKDGVPFCKQIKKPVSKDWFCADGKKEA